MKALYEIYDFVTGGSIAAPIGVAVAILVAQLSSVAPPVRAGFFVGILLLTFLASTLEPAK